MSAPVLVIEDEEALRRILSKNLARRGYIVREASTVQEALQSCGVNAPEVLVLDINLPDASGWDVLRGLAGHAARPKVVAISAAPPREDRLSEFNPSSFLQKPFPIEALLRAVDRAVAEVRNHGALDCAPV